MFRGSLLEKSGKRIFDESGKDLIKLSNSKSDDFFNLIFSLYFVSLYAFSFVIINYFVLNVSVVVVLGNQSFSQHKEHISLNQIRTNLI